MTATVADAANSQPRNAPFGQVIGIRCRVEQGVVSAVHIQPRRPLLVASLLAGKPVEAIPSLVSVLFTVCRHAHGLAGTLALAAATDMPVTVERWQRMRTLCDLESLREHALNLLQALPPGDSGQVLAKPLTSAVSALCRSLEAGASTMEWDGIPVQPLHSLLGELFGEFRDFGDPGLDQVLAWAATNQAPAARLVQGILQSAWADFGACRSNLLPDLPMAQLDAILARESATAFLRAPTWEGMACETGCFVRQSSTRLLVETRGRYGNGLLARSLARMLEIKRLFDGLRTLRDSEPMGSDAGGRGTGLAQVDASRGRLIHRAVVDAGKVLDYQILAPTEWNFHPGGLVHEALLGAVAPTAEELRGKIMALLRSIDPCVEFDLELLPAADAGGSRTQSPDFSGAHEP